jgi:hypothetical protein
MSMDTITRIFWTALSVCIAHDNSGGIITNTLATALVLLQLLCSAHTRTALKTPWRVSVQLSDIGHGLGDHTELLTRRIVCHSKSCPFPGYL